MDKSKLDMILNIIRENLYEDVPTMNLGAAKIAGTAESDPGNPPVKKKKRFIFSGLKSRTPWVRNLKKK